MSFAILGTSWSKNLETAILDQIKRRINVYYSDEFNKKALTLGNCAFNYNTFHLEPTSPSHLQQLSLL